jgi:hypothetical protein
LNEPFPKDGSDKTGGDRFRTVVPLPDGRFLVAGSVSSSAQAPNRGAWRIVADDLKDEQPLMVMNNPRSTEILDAALSVDAGVLAVGRWMDESGRRMGWSGFIHDAKSSNIQASGDRRLPDSQLPRLKSLPVSNDAFQIPDNAISKGAAYYDEAVAAGSQIDLRLSLARTETLRISAHTKSGDGAPDRDSFSGPIHD